MPVAFAIVLLIAAAQLFTSVTRLQIHMRLQLHRRAWLTGKLKNSSATKGHDADWFRKALAKAGV